MSEIQTVGIPNNDHKIKVTIHVRQHTLEHQICDAKKAYKMPCSCSALALESHQLCFGIHYAKFFLLVSLQWFFFFVFNSKLSILSFHLCVLSVFTVTFCSFSVYYINWSRLKITIEKSAIKFIKRSRMSDAHRTTCDDDANKRTMRETTNIIKVKHRLYYSHRWNCFLFGVDCVFYNALMLVSPAHIETVSTASMADMFTYVHRFGGIPHFNLSHSCSLYAHSPVCLPISCLSLSISFAWRKPVFLWHLSTSLLGDPSAMFQSFFSHRFHSSFADFNSVLFLTFNNIFEINKKDAAQLNKDLKMNNRLLYRENTTTHKHERWSNFILTFILDAAKLNGRRREKK